MLTVRAALDELFASGDCSVSDKVRISDLVQQCGLCEGLAEKLKEYTHPRAKLWNLAAELRMAATLSSHLGPLAAIALQVGESPDLLLRKLVCTVEVENKSNADAFADVFSPDSQSLQAYALGGKPWQKAALQLHEVVQALPVEIQPWVEGCLVEPVWSGIDRDDKDALCGQLAEWLATELRKLLQDCRTTLCHQLARFDVSPLERPPGMILGAGQVSVSYIREHPRSSNGIPPRKGLTLEERLGEAIRNKSGKHPTSRGTLHLVGLVVDEAYASDGFALARVLLGPLVFVDRSSASGGGRHYRGIPHAGQSLLQAAVKRGREDLLNLAQLDPGQSTPTQALFFEPTISERVDGILALYYTDELQFIPNPFSKQDIEPLCAAFPRQLKPFRVSSRAFSP